jgi:hypothetical protein
MFTQHFFIEGRYLGSVKRKFDLALGGSPLSYGFFCHCCGEVFAKCPVELPREPFSDVRGLTRPWQFWARTCRKCEGSETLGQPGSIWLTWDTEFTEAFPLAGLQWEFERELERQGL